MNDLVLTVESRLIGIAALIAAQLDGGSLRLFQNDITPDRKTLVADLDIATYTGYANKTIATWGAPYLDVNGLASCVAPLQTFAATGDAISNTVYGAYYLDSGGDLVWAVRFSDPWTFNSTGDTYNMVPLFQYGAVGEG